MKKINNKGFAISTLLYGLLLVAFLVISLLMSVMSNNRKNTSTLIRKIEDELNRYSQTATIITSTDGAQEFIVPYGKAGWYKIELWGAAARDIVLGSETEAKRGAYTSGIIYLEENQHLYFQIGTVGGPGTKNNIDTTNNYGGGATDVRLVGGTWDTSASKNSRIMVAAGGGYSAASNKKGSGYESSYYTKELDGGSYISGYAIQPPPTGYTNYKFLNTIMLLGVNGGAGKAKIELVSTQGKDDPPSKKSTNLNNVRYIKNCIKYTVDQPEELWREIQAIDSNGINVAKGKNVRTANYYSSLSASSPLINSTGLTDDKLDEVKLASRQTSNYAKVDGFYTSCIYLDLGSAHNLEEIRIFHDNPDPLPGTNTIARYSLSQITVKGSSGSERVILDTNSFDYTPSETYMGVRVSDRVSIINKTGIIPVGNYYIQSATSDNRFATIDSARGYLKLFTGENNQRLSVVNIEEGQPHYKILNGEDQKAFQPIDGGLEVGELISTDTEYQGHNWQKWEVKAVAADYGGNGYYQIKTMSGTNLCLATINGASNRDKSDKLQLKTCDEKDVAQWFSFINADY